MSRPTKELTELQSSVVQLQVDLGATLLRNAEFFTSMALEMDLSDEVEPLITQIDCDLKALHLVLNKALIHFDLAVSKAAGGPPGGGK